MKKITMTDLNFEASEATKSHVESVKAELIASAPSPENALAIFRLFSGYCQCPDGTYKKNCC
jgi:hypothetical protein